jgi:hypothetical protein
MVPINPDYDFGSIRAGDAKPITHSFEFKNAGEEPLLLSKIKPSCGCASSIPSATEIAPGETGRMVTTVNTKGKFGKQSVSVRVGTNDPTNPNQVFKLTGMILSDWRILPARIEFGGMGKDETHTKDVQVSSQFMEGDPVYRIVRIKTSSPDVTAVTAENVVPENPAAASQGYKEVRRTVQVTINSGQTEGDHTHSVFIGTDDPKSPTQTVAVRWTVEGDIAFTPKRIFVSQVKDKNVTHDITITSRSGKPFEVPSIEVQGSKGNEDLEVVPKEGATPTNKIYMVSVKFQSEKGTDTRSGKIIFHTSIPEQPTLVVPYTAVLRK